MSDIFDDVLDDDEAPPALPVAHTIRGNLIARDMPAATYHADPCVVPSLSPSIAKVLVEECPAIAHSRHPRFGGRSGDHTNAMDFGSIGHAILLGKDWDRIGVVYVPRSKKDPTLVPARDWRTDAAKEARDSLRSEGKTPALQKQVDRARTLVDSARPKLLARGIDLSGGEAEVSLFWEATATNGNKVQCRCRLDWIKNSLMRDVKICDSAHPRAVQAAVDSLGHYIQAAANREALGANVPDLIGRIHYEWVFIESEWPHCVNPSTPSGMLAAAGEQQWQWAVDTWERCLRTGEWPEYTAEDVISIVEPSRRLAIKMEETAYEQQ